MDDAMLAPPRPPSTFSSTRSPLRARASSFVQKLTHFPFRSKSKPRDATEDVYRHTASMDILTSRKLPSDSQPVLNSADRQGTRQESPTSPSSSGSSLATATAVPNRGSRSSMSSSRRSPESGRDATPRKRRSNGELIVDTKRVTQTRNTNGAISSNYVTDSPTTDNNLRPPVDPCIEASNSSDSGYASVTTSRTKRDVNGTVPARNLLPIGPSRRNEISGGGDASSNPLRAPPSLVERRTNSGRRYTVGPSGSINVSSPMRLGSLPPTGSAESPTGPLRLSPTVVLRHPPLPLMKLPALPPVIPASSSQESSAARPKMQERLRSMPLLSLEGRGAPNDPDHEHTTLGDESDEEDEEDGPGQEGSDDDDGPSPPPSRQSYEQGPLQLPPIDTTNTFDFSSLSATPSTPRAFPAADLSTPTATRPNGAAAGGYFPATPASSGSIPLRTPRASQASPLPRTSITNPPTFVLTPASPGGSSTRPSIIHQASRSMIDLSSFALDRTTDDSTNGRTEWSAPQRYSKLFPDLNNAQVRSSSSNRASQPTSPIKRRTSMPMFKPEGEPPPYPEFLPSGFRPSARPEEGQERLPPYTNDLRLVAIMPRKVEFSAPGVQAKDRKWRRTLCVLEGTCFKVYKPPRESGSFSAWWEDKVGVGDVLNEQSGGTIKDGTIRIHTARRGDSDTDQPKWSRRQTFQDGSSSSLSESSSSLLQPPPSSSRSSSSTPRPSIDSSRPSSRMSVSRSGSGSSPHIRTSTSSSSSRTHFRSHSRTHSGQISPSAEELEQTRTDKDLLRAYTMQHAESGLGSDYIKRKNVIRVRMEGEQFLLQAPDVSEVVTWIEGFQAAANIALDLDDRVMPRGPLFPRRRRRRRTRPEPQVERPMMERQSSRTSGVEVDI